MSNTEDTNYSFCKLIEQYHVVIPMIQRDYVQGRDNPEVSRVRDTFLKALKGYLEANDTGHDLGFVYGSVRGSAPDLEFIPLDGQQRLTTLFLLH